ncbi:MAG: CvpA family protein [Rikenellaceae bacterium]
MNIIDIVVCVLLLFAIYNGWRRGFILQICSLVGLYIGVCLGTRFGEAVGRLFHFSDKYASIGGFAIIFIVVLILVVILSHLGRGIFKIAGLGIFDVVLGAAFSVLKCAVIIAILLATFDGLNKDLKIVDSKRFENSITYKPLVDLSRQIIPSLQWAQGKLDDGIKKL